MPQIDVLPRVVVRVRKAVRRLAPVEPTGAEIEARWRQMLRDIDRHDREADRRLADAERALNRLTLS